MRLWVDFLALAKNGISLNRLTLREPSQICWSDSCPYGLGGYHLLSGRAWRLRIPPSSPLYGDDVVNNLLEFLGMAVSIWITVLECDTRGLTHECILALGDNTSALGWIHRCALEEGSIYYNAAQMTARQIARLLSDSSHCLASQHLKGATNDVPDFLSFEGHLRQDKPPHPLAPDCPSDAELTRRFHSFLPQVIPENFEILPLPNEVLSFVMRVLQTAESSWTRNKKSLTNATTGSSTLR